MVAPARHPIVRLGRPAARLNAHPGPLPRRSDSLMADGTPPAGNQLVSFFHEAPNRRSSSNSLGVELLPIESAASFELQGPTVAGIVYVRHPLNSNELIAFADYDERLAQDRYEEALRVFTSLGAARIVATSHRQTTRRLAGRLSLLRHDTSFVQTKDAAWSLAFNQEGDGGPAVDPRPLRFRDVPGLEQVCEGVLHCGWKKGRIQITKSAKLGVDGDLAIKLKRAGFRLGVSGSKVMVTEFVIEAAFTPEASRDLDALVATTEPAATSTLLPAVRGKTGARRFQRANP